MDKLPQNHEKINLIILPVWTIGREVSSGYEVVSGHLRLWQRGPAPHSSAQLAIVDRQPRQMASNQTALLAFGLD